MPHQQQRDNLAIGQAGLKTRAVLAGTYLMCFPLWLEGLAKIIRFTKCFNEPIQHGHLHVGRLISKIIDSQRVKHQKSLLGLLSKWLERLPPSNSVRRITRARLPIGTTAM